MENTVKKKKPERTPWWSRSYKSASAGDVVQSLVQEDPVIHGATKPVYQNNWVCMQQLLKPVRREPCCNKTSHLSEKAAHHNEEQTPLATTRESLWAATKAQGGQKLTT